MGSSVPTQQVGWRWPGVPHVLLLLGLALCLSGCDPSGDQGSLSPPDGPSVQAEQQAIQRLLGLYSLYVVGPCRASASSPCELPAGELRSETPPPAASGLEMLWSL
jgi:hypothetical protein